MSNKKTVICTTCPRGCHVEVEVDGDKVTVLGGNSCPRGAEYAINEVTNPVRTLTTTVKLESNHMLLLPVRTDKPISKKLLRECVKEANKLTAKAPISMGDIVKKDILGTGANLIASLDVIE